MSSVVQFTTGGPAFGQANLTNCESEKIHLPGSIQPHGALLVLDQSTGKITKSSENAADFFSLPSTQGLLGASISVIDPSLENQLKAVLAQRKLDSPATLLCDPKSDLDCTVHRVNASTLILEFERSSLESSKFDISSDLQIGIEQLKEAASLSSLCDNTVALFRRLFGYNRVMIYRFAPDGHGEVFAEQCDADMESYLGNHYPASDIPNIARELYKKNHIRMLVDVNYKPAVLRPKPNVGETEELDMSLCHLRSMSPIHLQYVKNMGVQATLVISLMTGDRLWGLINCSHTTPRYMGAERRLLAELIGEITATRISALESLARTTKELSVQQLEKSMIESITSEGDWAAALSNSADQLLQPMDATGALLITQENTVKIGTIPEQNAIDSLVEWLDSNTGDDVFATPSIALDYPHFDKGFDNTPGVVAARVSRRNGEYVIWFRPEHVRTICWGGKPEKLSNSTDQPLELSPRQSFSKWTELLQSTSDHWNAAELSAARLISGSIADVLQQFRAMRLMIAHDQLESLSNQITDSDLPALIADAKGGIVIRNRAFDDLLWDDPPSVRHISDLPRLFQESALASHNLQALVDTKRSWRGRATLDAKPVLVRADAVFSAPGQVLGYVVLVTDVSDRQLAENTRRRFPQQNLSLLVGDPEISAAPMRDLYDGLLNVVLENAQLAAMEITDGIDAQRIPVMLASVEASVSRTSRLINDLITRSDSKKS